MTPIHLEAMGLAGPGMAGWADSIPALADESA